MASIIRRGKTWQVRVRRRGVEQSGSFGTRAAALEWAMAREAEAVSKWRREIPNKSFGDLIERYMREVLEQREGGAKDVLRLRRLLGNASADPPVKADPIVSVPLSKLDAPDVADWRDRRLRIVKTSSVNREWNTLSNVCTIAVKDWKWLKENPFHIATRPVDPPPRCRRPTPDEIARLRWASGYDENRVLDTSTSRVVAAFLFAIETAMREGEISALKWPEVDFQRRVAKVSALDVGARKSGVSREVPLSNEAVRILHQLESVDPVAVFKLRASLVDALFRKLTAHTLIADLHFHDSRREALTRLATKVDVMTLAKISGHRDLSILLNTYYAHDMAQVASRI